MAGFTIQDSLKKHDKDKDGQISKKEFLGEDMFPYNYAIQLLGKPEGRLGSISTTVSTQEVKGD